jgi:hypothetical protein
LNIPLKKRNTQGPTTSILEKLARYNTHSPPGTCSNKNMAQKGMLVCKMVGRKQDAMKEYLTLIEQVTEVLVLLATSLH